MMVLIKHHGKENSEVKYMTLHMVYVFREDPISEKYKDICVKGRSNRKSNSLKSSEHAYDGGVGSMM